MELPLDRGEGEQRSFDATCLSYFRCGVTQPTAAALQPSSAERAIRDPKIDYSF